MNKVQSKYIFIKIIIYIYIIYKIFSDILLDVKILHFVNKFYLESVYKTKPSKTFRF